MGSSGAQTVSKKGGQTPSEAFRRVLKTRLRGSRWTKSHPDHGKDSLTRKPLKQEPAAAVSRRGWEAKRGHPCWPVGNGQ